MIQRLLALISVITMTAACSGTVGGLPSPAPEPATPQLPPRPREVRINGLDPCAALTATQLRALDVRFYATDKPREKRGPGCDWIHSPSEPIESYTVAVNTQGGVELLFGQPQLDVVTVAGFGAVQTPGLYSTGDDNCFIHVDVAVGQAVQIGYIYNGSTVPMYQEIACPKAHDAAELAMPTILARAGG